MLFMVIERFKERDAKAVYRRLRERGRGAPEGLRYVDSWVEASFGRTGGFAGAYHGESCTSTTRASQPRFQYSTQLGLVDLPTTVVLMPSRADSQMIVSSIDRSHRVVRRDG